MHLIKNNLYIEIPRNIWPIEIIYWFECFREPRVDRASSSDWHFKEVLAYLWCKYKRKVIIVHWLYDCTVSNSFAQKLIASYRISSQFSSRNVKWSASEAYRTRRESRFRNNSPLALLKERSWKSGREESAENVEYEDTRRECMPRANYRRRRAGRAYLYTGGTLAPSSRCARSRSRRTAPRRLPRIVDEHRLLDLP